MTDELKKSLLGSKLRLRSSGPFFTTLIAHLKIVQVADDDPHIKTAATNGKTLFINGLFWMALSPEVRDFVLLHETLHCALGHCWRVKGRQPERWNIACDYVVNLIAEKAGYKIWEQAYLDKQYDKMTSDEVYALLPEDPETFSWGLDGDIQAEEVELDEEEARKATSMWRQAIAKAKTLEKLYGATHYGDYISFDEETSIVDWRVHLWKMFDSQQDYVGFDRRLMYAETYVEDLVTSLSIGVSAICIDTSGSTVSIMGHFIGEVKAIADLVEAEIPLYYEDSELIGPLPLEELDRPIGGGGTSFVPFFEEVEKMRYERVVYLTDLCGQFPESTEAEVLWVVPPGCTIKPPFGTVVKILN